MEADADDENCIDYVFAPTGLYPLPMARNAKCKFCLHLVYPRVVIVYIPVYSLSQEQT